MTGLRIIAGGGAHPADNHWADELPKIRGKRDGSGRIEKEEMCVAQRGNKGKER